MVVIEEGLIRFGWVGFYGISTIVGYLMTNRVYTYTLDMYNVYPHFVDNIFK